MPRAPVSGAAVADANHEVMVAGFDADIDRALARRVLQGVEKKIVQCARGLRGIERPALDAARPFYPDPPCFGPIPHCCESRFEPRMNIDALGLHAERLGQCE